MSKLNLYTATGAKSKRTLDLPKNFQGKENPALLAQAIRIFENRSHAGVSKTKTRGEVTASTRKIYRQKGTGRARHGAVSAPIFVGGGKAHGPDGRKRKLVLPKKMAKIALATVMLIMKKKKSLVSVDGFLKVKRTKEGSLLLEKILKDLNIEEKNPKVLIALSEKNKDAAKYFRNIKNVRILPFRNLNAYEVYNSSLVILDKEALDQGTEKKGTVKKTGPEASKSVMKNSKKEKGRKVKK